MAGKKPFPEFDMRWPQLDKSFWEKLAVPGLDATALMQAQQKNIEALMQANSKAAEGYEALLKRQGEILGETMHAIQEAAATLMKANSGGNLPKQQAEMIQKAVTTAFGHMKELADLAVSANGGAMKVMQDRAMESIAEMKALAESLSAGKGKPAGEA